MKNNNYKIVKEYSLKNGEEICKNSKSKRLKSLYQLGTTCSHCGAKATKYALGLDRGNNKHLDLYCDDMTMMTIDHIIPKSKGGSNSLDNYQLLCKPCNQTKADNDDPYIKENMKLIKKFNSFINESSEEVIIAKDKDQLFSLIRDGVEKYGPNVNLNHIDVSNIRDMGGLFMGSRFNGDISNWDVSNVTDMSGMFLDSKFNGDISKWNVSNVKDMSYMFFNSKFNGDISNWDVSSSIKIDAFVYSSIDDQKLPFPFNGKLYKKIPESIIDNYEENNEFIDIDKYTINRISSLFNSTFSLNYNNYNLLIFNENNIIEIWMIEDDWYIIRYQSNYFKCDGLDGIKEFIKNWKL